MNLVDTSNHEIFKNFFTLKAEESVASIKESDFLEIKDRITPRSYKVIVAGYLRPLVRNDVYQKLLVKETYRLFQEFLKTWLPEITEKVIKLRSLPAKESLNPFSALKKDSSLIIAELNSVSRQADYIERISKKRAFLPDKKPRLSYIKQPKTNEVTGVFKALSGQQLAGELASYLLGIFCGIDVFHTVVPSYTWIQDMDKKVQKFGIFSSYHQKTKTAFELSCSKSEGFEAMKRIQAEYVQAICLMHMLRGSEDAHMNNTLFEVLKDPITGELTIVKIYEIDGEHIMSSSKRDSDRYEFHKQVASMRIWWLGLPQAAKPLNEPMLQLILSWSREKLYELHSLMNLYSDEKINAQLWRLEKMRTMAKDALLYKRPISARDIFFELIHRHPTLGLLSQTCDNDLWIYNQVGSASADEILDETLTSPTSSFGEDELLLPLDGLESA